MIEIEYKIRPKIEDANHNDIDILNSIEDMGKIRNAIDEVFSELDDIPECGEHFLWKVENRLDHVFFSFEYKESGEYIVTVKDCCLWVEDGHFDNGCKSNTFLEIHNGEFEYSAY